MILHRQLRAPCALLRGKYAATFAGAEAGKNCFWDSPTGPSRPLSELTLHEVLIPHFPSSQLCLFPNATCRCYFVFNGKRRVSEIKGIPGADMEVVIFEVGDNDRSGYMDGSSICSSMTGSRSSSVYKNEGPISICLWTPMKCELVLLLLYLCAEG